MNEHISIAVNQKESVFHFEVVCLFPKKRDCTCWLPSEKG